MTVSQTMTPREWTILLVLSLLWGGSYFFIGVAVKDLPPLTIVASRVVLAAAVLALVLVVFGKGLPRSGAVWRAFVGMGILNNVIPFCLIVWGQTQIASGLAAIFNAMTPMFTVLVAHFLTQDERISMNRGIGVLLGLAGVAYLVGGSALTGLGSSVLAELAVLAAALSYALAGVYGRRFKTLGVEPMHAATGQLMASSVLLVPVALIIDQPWLLTMPGWESVAAVAALAVVSTSLAYILYFRLLATAGATNLLLVTLLIPVSAIVLGVSFLGETFALRHGIGMALIAAGLLAIDGRLFNRVRSS